LSFSSFSARSRSFSATALSSDPSSDLAEHRLVGVPAGAQRRHRREHREERRAERHLRDPRLARLRRVVVDVLLRRFDRDFDLVAHRALTLQVDKERRKLTPRRAALAHLNDSPPRPARPFEEKHRISQPTEDR